MERSLKIYKLNMILSLTKLKNKKMKLNNYAKILRFYKMKKLNKEL